MSVAHRLGLESMEAPLFVTAREWWVTAQRTDDGLASVDVLDDVMAWTYDATGSEVDRLQGRLAERAVAEEEAATALAWLLIPGASDCANRHRDLSADIDDLVAGQLWLEVRTHGGHPTKAIAFTILQNTKRAVLADLGVGDGIGRQDKAWANSVITDWLVARGGGVPDDGIDPRVEVCALLGRMLDEGALTPDEVGILASAAEHADWLDAPVRGRAGLTTPGALEVLTWLAPRKARTMRRTVCRLLERVAQYVREHGNRCEPDDYPHHAYSEWNLTEFAMIVADPKNEARLRRFHQDTDLIARCRALRSTGQAVGDPRCPCGGTGECDSWVVPA